MNLDILGYIPYIILNMLNRIGELHIFSIFYDDGIIFKFIFQRYIN